MKRILLAIILFSSFFANVAYSADSSRTLSVQAEDECRSKIMSLSAEDLRTLNPNSVIDACQSFPLSDDISVQLLAALIGPDISVILDVYSAFVGKPHGLDSGSPILTVATPLHDVMYSFNLFFLTVLLVGIGISLLVTAFRGMRGERRFSIKDWIAKEGTSKLVSILLSLPVIGWLTPIQGFALLLILLLGFVSKLVVTVLFLAAFFGNTGMTIKDEIEDELLIDFGRTIMMYQCDIERREYLVEQVQTYLRTKEVDELKKNDLYSCLTLAPLASGVSSVVSQGINRNIVSYTPRALNQTQLCIDGNRDFLNKVSAAEPPSCGYLQFSLPNNKSYPSSLVNAIELYSNSSVERVERELAVQVHEFKCRVGSDVKNYQGEIIPKCLKTNMNGDGYSYGSIIEPVTERQVLINYDTPLTETSRETFSRAVKRNLSNLTEMISSNTSAMKNHLSDLLAGDSEDLPDGMEERIDALKERMSEDSSLGVSEHDVNFVVDNIQRGAWTSSSLFFGKLSDGLEEEVIINSLRDVYSVVNKDESGFLNSDLLVLLSMQAMTGEGGAEELVEKYITPSIILPRLGLYSENLDCWYSQVDCSTPPLNPFTYLSERGAWLIERASLQYLGTAAMQKSAKFVFSFSEKDKYAKFMILETLGELQLLYLLIGIGLCVIIPAMPLLKLLSMMINWTYDITRELAGLQIKVAFSSFSDHGKEVISQDLREAFQRTLGLGVYFLFVVVGLVTMFLMFSFLFALDVFLIGILSSIVSWNSDASSIHDMVLYLIFDLVITLLLFFQVKKCTPYIEKVPRVLAEEFNIKITNSDGILEESLRYARENTLLGVAQFLHRIK